MTVMPPFDENNVHSIEFEAPLSADASSSAAAKKHFSIDLSLELERQLDMESYPPTPAHHTESHSRQQGSNGSLAHESLDPHVLAHIIKQLQQSLAEVTKDRDELLQMVALSHSHEAEMKDALQHMTDKATTMEVELSDARRKIKDDEDAISMLRTKVEESRRGLMRLQTESRRQSMAPMTIDIARAGIPAFGSPPSSKRASFAPLTGTYSARPAGMGHRRISSVSDAGAGFSDLSTSPNAQTLVMPDGSTSHLPPVSSYKYSGLFGRPSPPHSDPSQPDPLSVELEALRKEMQTVKDELDHTKHELSESNEAREASETCVKALRDFIAEVSAGAPEAAGLTSLKLPPPPTMANGNDDDDSKKTATVGAWGFKLWKDATLRTPSIPQSATIAPPPIAPAPQVPMTATPLSRKIGGFFGSRASVSSAVSSINTPPLTALPQLQTNAATSIRDSTYSFSDTSSMAEPISPPNEINPHFIVRDVTNLSDVGSLGPGPEVGKEIQPNMGSRQGTTVL